MIVLMVCTLIVLVSAVIVAWANEWYVWMATWIIVFTGLFIWIILAGIYGTHEIESETLYKVHTITEDDGTSMDIILLDGKPINATTLMKRTCTGLRIRRRIYSVWAGGIDWLGTKITYETVEPDPEENPYSISYP